MIATNKYQTPLTDELLDSLNEEIRDNVLKDITSIEFIRRLISPNRKYARDLKRDSKGRIIIDICNPHILEDMEYFRPAGNFYKQNKCYTKLRPNLNPNSEFGKWILGELDRIWGGYVRPSDGEWVTGEMYYYLNYSPIQQSKIREGNSKIADRITDFPEVHEGNYLWFHYLEQARYGGIYNNFIGGEHAAMISKRGAGKSYSSASSLSRVFVCGDSKISSEEMRAIIIASNKEYLIKDGTLNKFVSAIDFMAENMEFPARRLKSSLGEMSWKMGYIDLNTGAEKGTKNEVYGISIKDDPDKPRGKRGVIINFEEFGSFYKFIDTWNTCIDSVQEGSKVFGQLRAFGTGGTEGSDFSGALELIYNPKGYYIYSLPNVFDYNAQGKQFSVFFYGAYLNRKGCYNKDGVSDVIKALIERETDIYTVKYNSGDPNKVTRTKAEQPVTITDAVMQIESTIYPVADINSRLLEIDENPKFYDNVYVGRIDLKDGVTSFSPIGTSIRNFPHKDNKLEGAVEIFEMPKKDKNGEVFTGRYIAGCLIEGEMVNTDSGLKPVEKITLDDKLINIEGEEVSIINRQIYDNNQPVYKVKLNGILDTTTFSAEHPIYCSSPSTDNLDFKFKKVSELKIGDIVKSPVPYKDNIAYLKYNSREIYYLLGVMLQKNCCFINQPEANIFFRYDETTLIKKCTLIIKNILKTEYKTINTFLGILIKFQNDEFMNFYHNVFDFDMFNNIKISNDFKKICPEFKRRFISGYIDCLKIRKNSEIKVFSRYSSILKDLQDILFSIRIVSEVKEREQVGYNNTIEHVYFLTISRRYADIINYWRLKDFEEYRTTPYIEKKSKILIDYDYIYLTVESIEVIPDYKGNIYNFECYTHTFMCNYIPTHNCDPYDDDVSNTLSLGSVQVLDLWTDKIVAEYTGRPQFASEFYEQARRILMFYRAVCNYENNKKGLFNYFSTMNSLYLLTDVLQFLKDMDIVKGETYGNKQKGTVSTESIKKYARSCIKDYLLKGVNIIKGEKQEDGFIEEKEEFIPRVYTVMGRALLKELSMWTPNGNFDRHDALGMLMLLREDKLRLLGPNGVNGINMRGSTKYLGDDDFFSKNYDNKFNK